MKGHIEALYSEAERKMTAGMEILNPWDHGMTSREYALTHLALLEATYGGGHPGSKSSVEELEQLQTTYSLLTWVVKWNGHSVGMVNAERLPDGRIELVRSVEIPHGTRLHNGTVYQGEANVSSAMYLRLAQLLERPDIQNTTWAVEADLRMAADICLPSGTLLSSGVRTQHTGLKMGLTPWLIAVPRFNVGKEGGHSHQEVFLQSRRYLTKPNEEPIYTPTTNPTGRTSLAEVARATYELNGIGLETKDKSHCDAEITGKIIAEAGVHFTQVLMGGDLTKEQIINLLESGLVMSRFVEVILYNEPGNIQLQEKLMQLGVMPLGVFPGCERPNSNIPIKTTLHYGVARPDIVRQMVPIDFATDYDGTHLKDIAIKLRAEWDSSYGC